MSNMERRSSTISKSSELTDDSSWGEICTESLAEKETTSTKSSTRRPSAKSLDVDESSWGELDLDESLVDEEEESHVRRRATFGTVSKSNLLDDISWAGSSTRRAIPEDDEDEHEDINELASCLKTMYGDFYNPCQTSSNSQNKKKKTRKSKCKLPSLKRYITAWTHSTVVLSNTNSNSS